MIWVDGAMGTTLQRLGLPKRTPADTWVDDHPDDVVEVHRAFVQAGAEVICTATLCSSGADARRIERAVALARDGAEGRAAVFLSVGPGPERGQVAHAGRHADGVVLETFMDTDAALRALDEVRARVDLPVVVSVVPKDGRAWAGRTLAAFAQDARRAGATGVGLNCAPAAELLAALSAMEPALPVWLKPSGASAAELTRLVPYAHWVGGCCGTGPEVIAAAVGA